MELLDRLWADFNYLRAVLRTLGRIRHLSPSSKLLVPNLLEHWARKTPDRIAVYFEDRSLTYAELDAAANQVARWAIDQGMRPQDTVALLMRDRPEYLITWLGIAKMGGTTALINTALTAHPLAHCLNLVKADHLILGSELSENFESARALLDQPVKVWTSGGPLNEAENFEQACAAHSPSPLPANTREGCSAKDTCLYIYTSGTTGTPKAAPISHARFRLVGGAFVGATAARQSDRMYIPIPLYHTSGGVAAVGAMLEVGGSVILKDRFSANDFWDDCRRYKATQFQYVGELCRYLINTPTRPEDTDHDLRIIVGNGLRPDIWETFAQRFAIPKIVEFYASTEGNIALFNYDGKPGAVGRVPRYLRSLFPYRLVRFDVESEQPFRDHDGLCVPCETGEIGEIIGRITIDPDKVRGSFDGYLRDDETQKKIGHSVFENGDSWFRSGDLMRQDARGYYYFVDRVGDTYRWKGENVSTSEVTHAMTVHEQVQEANAYGVSIPGADGKAGMAAIVADVNLNLTHLHAHLAKELPEFARPLFLRIQTQTQITGTFKHRKVDLVKEGFNPKEISEPLFFDHPGKNAYVPLDEHLYEAIVFGAIRL